MPTRAGHGPGLDPAFLIGRRLTGVVAAWHVYEERLDPLPVEVWLLDDLGGAIRVASGTDWCLELEPSAPYEGYDMGDWRRFEVAAADDATPFARHLGETVLGAREEYEPLTGRIAVELDFASGTVRCASEDGVLHLRAVEGPATRSPDAG
ncbi:hypothetical protein [Streptomyces sp. CB01881]|uniref:hypothetical protein n=1 Tax=Streptomyces sp. CB01881 TaxID=2078691 RepID=UPI0018843C42|nr:hypothetical protein [Streptomyces sp. CB01881]